MSKRRPIGRRFFVYILIETVASFALTLGRFCGLMEITKSEMGESHALLY